MGIGQMEQQQQQQQHSNTFSGCRSLWPRLSLGTRVGQGTAAVDSIWPGDGATLFHLLPRPKPQQKVASCWTFFFIILHCRVFFTCKNFFMTTKYISRTRASCFTFGSGSSHSIIRYLTTTKKKEIQQ